MAVARIELMPSEVDWVVDVLSREGKLPKERQRAMREIKRAAQRAHEAEEREKLHTHRMRDAYRTADPGCEALDYKLGRAR